MFVVMFDPMGENSYPDGSYPDGKIESVVKNHIERYNQFKTDEFFMKNDFTIYVSNELYYMYLRVAIKDGLISHEEVSLQYRENEKLHTVTFDKNGKTTCKHPFSYMEYFLFKLLPNSCKLSDTVKNRFPK
jgi:hypothetical protein